MLSNLPKPGHKVQLYELGAFPSPAIMDFLFDGMAANSAVAIVVTQENFAHLARSFAERGVSLQDKIDNGAILYKDADTLLKSFVSKDHIDAAGFDKGLGRDFAALLEKYPAINVYTEMVDVLLHDGKIDLMLELEEVWNKFIDGRPIQLFFGYHIDWFRPEYGSGLIDRIVGPHNVLAPIHLNPNTPVQHALWIDFIHARKTRFRQELADLLAIEEDMARDLKSSEALSRGVIQKHDEQDRWVPHYLNDDLAENLVALQHNLAALPSLLKRLPPEEMAAITTRLEAVTALAKDMAASVRTTVDKIHSPLLEDFGVGAALRSFIYSTRDFSRAKVTLVVSPEEFRLPADLEQNVLEVMRETIANAVKHAQAQNIHVELIKQDSKLTCRVTDDGVGFDTGKPTDGLGLSMIRQRCALLKGELNVTSKLGSGTVVEFAINL